MQFKPDIPQSVARAALHCLEQFILAEQMHVGALHAKGRLRKKALADATAKRCAAEVHADEILKAVA